MLPAVPVRETRSQKAFFTALCAKYGLLGHIDGTEAACPADPLWSQPEACNCGWMYGSVDDTVLDLAMEPCRCGK
jgi:hypothetical protein